MHKRAPTLCLSLFYFQSPFLTSELLGLKGGGAVDSEPDSSSPQGVWTLCPAGKDGMGLEGRAWLGGDGLAKAASERTKERGPINILSWLPGRLTAEEMLR